MTAYNRERYIAEAIESVLAQTFTDFELIIVDDGSKDRTVEIARRYASDRRVSIHLNERNLGDYPNRNRAASLACGKYLKYLDADDLMYPHCLEIMVCQMELFPDAGLGFSKQVRKEWVYPVLLCPEDAYRLEFLGGGALGDGPSLSIYRTAVFQGCGGFPPERMTSDNALTLTMSSKFSVLFMVEGLVFYRRHESQESAWGYKQPEINGRYFVVHRGALRDDSCPLAPQERSLALRNLTGIHLRIIARKILLGHWNAAAELWRSSGMTWRDLRWALTPSCHRSPTDLDIQPRTPSSN